MPTALGCSELSPGGALTSPAPHAHTLPAALPARRYGEAMAQLKETFQNCHANPEAFAFLCDQLARTIARSTVGRQLLTDLADVLQSVLEDNFLADVVDGAAIAPPHAQVGVGVRGGA